LTDKIIANPKLTMAECIFVFNRISNNKEFVSLKNFREWVNSYGNEELKPLINVNAKLAPEVAEKISIDELSVPLAIKKLLEEMRDYGFNYIEDALKLYIEETIIELSENISPPDIIQPLSITNLQRWFSVLNIPVGIEDIHEIKNWLLENNLMVEYKETRSSGVVISFVIDCNKMWSTIMSLYEIPVESSELSGSTFTELTHSIQYTILQAKLDSIKKVM